MNRVRKPVAVLTMAAFLVMSACTQAVLQPNAPPDGDYYKGYMDGLTSAETRSGEFGWGLGSYAGTLVCCLIGLGVSSWAKSSGAAPPAEMLLGKSPEYIQGIDAGFKGKAQQKRYSAATTGLVLGMLTNVVVNLIVLASGGYNF